MMSQIILKLKEGRSETVKNDGSAQMVVVLTITEIRYVLLDPFDDLVSIGHVLLLIIMKYC